MEEAYTVTKSTIELYKIRSVKNSYWADISLDPGDKSGRINIASDFGRWSNYWCACGSSFKKFLASINMEYAADKFDVDPYFDADMTLEAYRKSLKDDSDISKEIAEEVLYQINSMKGIRLENEFVNTILYKSELMKYFDNRPELCRSIDPLFKMFWTEVWPVFLHELAKEEPSSEHSIATSAE